MKYQKVFIIALVIGLISPVAIIVLDLLGIISASETDMTNASFVYVPIIFFGLSGILQKNRFPANHKKHFVASFLYGLLSFFLLILFYGIIWPML